MKRGLAKNRLSAVLSALLLIFEIGLIVGRRLPHTKNGRSQIFCYVKDSSQEC
jgi:hypothetical protein